MKTKKLLTKKLLIFLLCFGIFMPTLSTIKPYVQQDNSFITPYSDYPNSEYEN